MATEQIASPDSIDSAPQSATSFIVAFVGSIFQTCGIVWMACDTPTTGALHLPHLFSTAAHFLLVAAAAHVFAVWVNATMFSGLVDVSVPLLALTIWPSVVWSPLLILLIKENSVWTILIPPLIFVSATRSLIRWTATDEATTPNQSQIPTLFQIERTQSFLRSIGPAIIAALAFQSTIAELALTNYFSSGLQLAAGISILIWSYPAKLRPIRSRAVPTSFRSVVSRTGLVYLLLAIALIPYLAVPRLAIGANAFMHIKPKSTQSKNVKQVAAHSNSDDSYLGIILLSPKKPHPRVIPQPAPIRPSSAPRQSVTIPFDGAYWYFKPPYQRPRPGAIIAHGDPTKKTIRSTNALPLLMEAHQFLGLPIRTTSFSAIRLSIENADHIPGAIFVEIRLRNIGPKGITSQSLGAQVLPSSTRRITYASLISPPVEELLTFHIPRSTRLRQFNEITVAIEPAKERSLVGTRVAVQSFELLP
ncbi:hypothetical protein [Edaphobacter acidisoli]|nr:hypothetical protein [Edaphobacter acidisoli]